MVTNIMQKMKKDNSGLVEYRSPRMSYHSLTPRKMLAISPLPNETIKADDWKEGYSDWWKDDE